MINFFDFAPDDKSLVWLQSLFGTMNGIIQSPEGGGGAITVLSTMFGVFNSVALAIAILVVVYVTVVGLITSAQEGEFMGREWNSFWVPFRVVLGLAALVPSGAGYCAIQLLMMWIIVQGVGAADTLWTTALNYADFAGSLFTQGSVPSTGVAYNLSVLFQNVVCDESARAQYDNPFKSDKGGYFCNGGGSWCNSATALDPQKSSYELGPSGACGSVSYCKMDSECKGDKSTSLACKSCQAQISALQQIIPTYRDIAKAFIQADYTYRDFTARSYNVENNPDWQFIYEFCSDNDIKQKNCCIPSVKDGSSDTCKVDSDKANELFPRVNGNTFSNTSKDAVNNLLWPYFMKPSLGNADFVLSASTFYVSNLEGAVVAYLNETGGTKLSGELKKAQNTGWILAGSFYYALAELNDSTFKSSMPSFKVTPSDANSKTSNDLYYERNNFDAADALIYTSANSAEGKSTETTSTGSESSDKSLGIINNGLKDMGTAVSGSITQTNTNPLARLQTAGRVLLIIAEILFIIFLIAAVLIAMIASISVWVFGTGAVNPAGPASYIMYFILVPLFFLLLGIMVTFGGLLGIYAPLIPYIVFTFGAIGWFTSCIETMAAGPLVAIGIMAPAHHHKVLGKAEPALLLLFNVFLRPSLMIFGLIAAMLLASVVITMINTGFSMVKSMISNGDPLSMILMLAAYVYLIVAALNKCFAAIHLIPEKVMRWIGGQGDQYGESDALGEAKKGVDGATSGTKGYMKDMKGESKAMGKGAEARHQANKGGNDGGNVSGAK